MSEFSGKTVLITGAGRGIGSHIAKVFGADGANVCVNFAHSATGAENVVGEIDASGGRAIACQANIADAGQVNAMVETILKTFGSVDVLVNNAGLSIDGPFLEMTETDWDQIIAVNLKGPFLVSQTVARHMIKNDGGVIINISATTTTQ